MTDRLLWTQLKEGNQQAFEAVYRRFFKDLYQYGLRFSKDRGPVEDAIQELFLELWNRRKGLSETDQIKHYLYVALRRKILRNLQKQRHEVSSAELEPAFWVEEDLHEVQDEEQKEKLARAMQSLPDRQKEILYLKFYAGMDYEEIVEIMDMNYQSARNLLSRAIKKLAKTLTIFLWIGWSI